MIDNRVWLKGPGAAAASPGNPFGRHMSGVTASSLVKIAIDGNAPGARIAVAVAVGL
jgi:hypothetical protein